MADWLTEALSRVGIRLRDAAPSPVGGGSINRAYRVSSEHGPLFVKVNEPTARDMFEAEAEGLALLARAGGARVPGVVAVGAGPAGAFLALEWLDLGTKTPAAQRELGAALARQHRRTATAFGWTRDNTIGATPQVNTRCDDWVEFFREQRLGFQLDLAERNGLPRTTVAAARRLIDDLEALFDAHAPAASLLHGDLWGGNWGATHAGAPVIFDPAVYFGDREADIAMTRLFGGFDGDFYAAYQRAWPLPEGFERRAEVYNLYHLLNHFNLFGAAYATAIQSSIDACGSESWQF